MGMKVTEQEFKKIQECLTQIEAYLDTKTPFLRESITCRIPNSVYAMKFCAREDGGTMSVGYNIYYLDKTNEKWLGADYSNASHALELINAWPSIKMQIESAYAEQQEKINKLGTFCI